MKRLALLFIGVAVAAGIVGSFLTVHYYNRSGWSDVGKALLTLAVTFSVGGAAATWIKVVEQTRENRAAWRDLLREVVEVDQTLAVARQLIAAHKTAKTYSEQYAKIVDARLTLRRVWLDPLVANDREGAVNIRSYLDKMKNYVDKLGEEYEKFYLRVGRQQRIDEVYLERRIGGLASPREASQKQPPTTGWRHGSRKTALLTDPVDRLADCQQQSERDDPAYLPTLAWKMLRDPGYFRRLVAFLDDGDYEESSFVEGFTGVKPMLEKRAGIKKRESTFQPAILPTHANMSGR